MMDQSIIKYILRGYFADLVEKYPKLSVKFELNDFGYYYRVSFCTDDFGDEDLTYFSIEVMEFEDKMNELFGYDAPVFTDNEQLFNLSENAEVICGIKSKLRQ